MKGKILTFTLLLLQLLVCTVSAITKREVQQMIEGQRYQQAIQALRTLMSSQPVYARDADCNKWLGQSLCLTGHYVEALPPLEYVVKNNPRSGAQWYLSIARQHLYEFDAAQEALDAYRPVLKSDLWLARADSLAAEIHQGIRAMEYVEDVVVVDSLLMPRSTFFSAYMLGPESGCIKQGTEGLYFESQAEDYRISVIDNHLYQSHKIQQRWEEKELLLGVGSERFHIIDPFLRGDGETLYFACDSTPGLGGFDLYMTKFNADEGVFYRPERLGLPFNSPFDDYMLAVDETHQLGWWATERLQHPDSVVIYLFLLGNEPQYLAEPTVARARIDCIADTWQQEGGYPELRLSALRSKSKQQPVTERVSILINDHKVYTSPSQFVSPQALAAYNESLRQQDILKTLTQQLVDLRKAYGQSSSAQRKSLGSQILQLEQKQLQIQSRIEALVKQYRRLEQ